MNTHQILKPLLDNRPWLEIVKDTGRAITIQHRTIIHLRYVIWTRQGAVHIIHQLPAEEPTSIPLADPDLATKIAKILDR